MYPGVYPCHSLEMQNRMGKRGAEKWEEWDTGEQERIGETQGKIQDHAPSSTACMVQLGSGG